MGPGSAGSRRDQTFTHRTWDGSGRSKAGRREAQAPDHRQNAADGEQCSDRFHALFVLRNDQRLYEIALPSECATMTISPTRSFSPSIASSSSRRARVACVTSSR